jgi:hypothetical protein
VWHVCVDYRRHGGDGLPWWFVVVIMMLPVFQDFA